MITPKFGVEKPLVAHEIVVFLGKARGLVTLVVASQWRERFELTLAGEQVAARLSYHRSSQEHDWERAISSKPTIVIVMTNTGIRLLL